MKKKLLSAEPSGLNIIQHVRSLHGHIVHSLPRALETHEVQVPAFGSRVDAFLDAFGYSDEFCHTLMHHYDNAVSILDFVNRMSEYLSREEAQWFWYWVERDEQQRPVRLRKNSI